MIENLLVPHDLTDYADVGFDALRLIGTPIHHLHVVHVLPRIDLTTPTMVWSRDEDEARTAHARGALKAWLLGTPYEGAVVHVRIGDPGSRIVELAKEIGADLIALASHGRTGMQRFILGSVSEHVARFAPCPVLVVPAHASIRDEPSPPTVGPDRTRDEQVDALAVELVNRVAQNPGTLTAVRIGLPDGEERDPWETALTRRLAEMGIEFVDLVFTPGTERRARLLALTFEERAG